MRHAPRLVPLLACLVLAACSGDADRAPGPRPGGGDDALPAPGAVSGSVTGMPDPGQAPVAPAPPAPDPASGPDPLAQDPALVAPDGGGMPVEAAEPGVDAAVEVMRRYYAAINARDHAGAHALWADGGRASGQSAGAFAAGFDAVDGASVQLGAPGPLAGDPGLRTVTIPASVEVRHADGSLRRYAGSYVLRMEGAEPGQRQWRIASATLEERP